jgi:putative ABC transport system ATP-binding protein
LGTSPRPGDGLPALALSSVTRTYGNDMDQTKAVDSISLMVNKGGIIALVGPSGSGKTTLLNLMAALDFPTSGSVVVYGVDTAQLQGSGLQRFRNETVGVVFQQFFLIDHLSALENVMVTLLPRKISPEAKKEQAKEALEKVGLGTKGGRYPSQLSGGELQRVAIARGIVGDPQVILADEPTGNLDLKRGMEIVEILAAESKARDKTVVIATHDPRILERVDGAAYLEDGVLTRVEGSSIRRG